MNSYPANPMLWSQPVGAGASMPSAPHAGMFSNAMYAPHMPPMMPGSSYPPFPLAPALSTQRGKARAAAPSAAEAAYWQHMPMYAQPPPHPAQQSQQFIHPYMHYLPPAYPQPATAHTAVPFPSQPAPSAKPAKSHKKRSRTKQRTTKTQSITTTTTTPHSPSAPTTRPTTATQPSYAPADPCYHPYAAQSCTAQCRSRYASHGRDGRGGADEGVEDSGVVMEASLEELFEHIPTLPEQVVASEAVGSQLREEGVAEGTEEMQQEADRVCGSTTQHAVQHLAKPAEDEEQKEAMSDIDTSRASDGEQEFESIRALGQQVERIARQLPVRSLHATSRLLNSPAAYTTHQTLSPTPPITLALTTAPSPASRTLRFAWPSLLGQVCAFLQRSASAGAERLSVDECGAVGSFVADEVRLHAIEMSVEHVADFQRHVDELLDFMLQDAASDVAVERLVRFLRALGSSVHTAPLVLSAAVNALHTFMQLVHHSTTHHPASPATTAIAFTTTHLIPILRSHHLCHLIESFVLLARPSPLWLPAVADCVARLQAVYEWSLCDGVYGCVPLLCAYVWRIRSVVDGASASQEAETVFEFVRRERTSQREAAVKREDDALLEGRG